MRIVHRKHAMVTPLTFVGDRLALVQALRTGHPGAAAAFYDLVAVMFGPA
jgi:hypothetical protein